MNPTATGVDVNEILTELRAAESTNQISAAAIANIRLWLTDSRYQKYANQIVEHVRAKKFKQLDDVFWTVIPFGTGGRRGRMYPIGCNAINEQTIGESAQGLADYVRKFKPSGPWSAAIAYDTRHRSREFAELCAEILVANHFQVFFIDDYRSTPELSFLVRLKQCDCGIMVTASHNPPSDNAVKVYWSNGAQLIPPHDQAVINHVASAREIRRVSFQHGLHEGQIRLCRDEADAALLREHQRLSWPGPRNIKIIYSPLHGVGEFNVKSLLTSIGFADLEIYERHREPSGDFPNVPNNVSNPENAAVFDEIITRAQSIGANLILATDPDCDRMGAAAPKTNDSAGPWMTFNGNQLSALLCEYLLKSKQRHGGLLPTDYIVTTLVTTKMLARIAAKFGVRCLDNNLVGFKWICSVMDQEGPDSFLYGTEESHGFLIGKYCRDKDGAIACMLMSQLAAEVQASGKSIFEHLDTLYQEYGYHGERLATIQMEGSDGMRRMASLMDAFRSSPPLTIGNLRVAAVRDYLKNSRSVIGRPAENLNGPKDNLVFLETEIDGNYIAARPSGTEPKVKFYMFTFEPPGGTIGLESVKCRMNERLDGFAADLSRFASSIE